MRQIATQDLESQNIYESAKGVIFTGLPENPADHLIRVRMTLTNLEADVERMLTVWFRNTAGDMFFGRCKLAVEHGDSDDVSVVELGPFTADVSLGLQMYIQSSASGDTSIDAVMTVYSVDPEFLLSYYAAPTSPTNNSLTERIKAIDDATDPMIVREGTAQAGAASTITLDGGASATDDLYAGLTIVTTGGTGAGQSRRMSSYVGSTRVATVDAAWATNPDDTTTFAILGTIGPSTGNVTVGAFLAAALAQLFTLDSTKTKDDAVSGSVVNETAAKAAAGLSTKTVKISES